jgi:hypothetical protein
VAHALLNFNNIRTSFSLPQLWHHSKLTQARRRHFGSVLSANLVANHLPTFPIGTLLVQVGCYIFKLNQRTRFLKES